MNNNHWTIEQLRHFYATGETPEDISRKKALDKAATKAVRQKYRNKIIKNEGITFRSQKEYDRYYNNILRVRSGELMFFLFQIPFWLEGGIKYIADFIEVYPAWGRIDIIDTKGYRTREFINKKKQCEARYGIKIIEI
ncbi:MAG: DUF1064 domain-containing protein [Candidatus Hodarchaeales archaeon]|jgi:hypothetical protein